MFGILSSFGGVLPVLLMSTLVWWVGPIWDPRFLTRLFLEQPSTDADTEDDTESPPAPEDVPPEPLVRIELAQVQGTRDVEVGVVDRS